MSKLIDETIKYVNDLLSNQLDTKYLYHNLKHTERVVKSTKELIDFYSLNSKDSEVLLLAAWFHDTGYSISPSEHEDKSCVIAREFLKKNNVEKETVENVCSLIKATKRHYEPTNLEEEIIRDADCSHFGQKSYLETASLLKKELDQLGLASYSRNEWCNENIKMLQKEHQFYTDYAKKIWKPTKEKNIKKLMQAKKENKIAKKEALKAKYKSESPDRGIQTLFRVTLRNHITLSNIADTKANILLSVNAIIISMALSNLIPKLDNPSNEYLIYPTLIFIVFSVVSMVLSILATRPNVTQGEFTKEDIEQRKVNLLFFGNFHQMKLAEYEIAIQELIKNKEYMYSSLTKDLYFLGKVLNKKYKILRWTYTIFMIGMVVSVIAFAIAFKFYGPDRSL